MCRNCFAVLCLCPLSSTAVQSPWCFIWARIHLNRMRNTCKAHIYTYIQYNLACTDVHVTVCSHSQHADTCILVHLPDYCFVTVGLVYVCMSVHSLKAQWCICTVQEEFQYLQIHLEMPSRVKMMFATHFMELCECTEACQSGPSCGFFLVCDQVVDCLLEAQSVCHHSNKKEQSVPRVNGVWLSTFTVCKETLLRLWWMSRFPLCLLRHVYVYTFMHMYVCT